MLSAVKRLPVLHYNKKKSKRNVQGVPHSQAAAHPRHEEQEETEKKKKNNIKQQRQKKKKKKKKKKKAQIEQTHEKHQA